MVLTFWRFDNKMKKIQVTTSVIGLAMLLSLSSYTFAQSTSTPESATVEKIMEQAVRNLTMRYNLNEQQTKKTQEIMSREVHKFLREHENDVWPVIRDLLKTGLKPSDNPEDGKRIGKAALPLIELAKEAIDRGNEEWRQYLTPDQKRMHDFDLNEMDRNFQQIERNFQQLADGSPTKQLFPQPNPNNKATPARPQKPTVGLPQSEPVMFDPFRIFSAHVEDFILLYQLSEGQIDAARSILEEFRSKATDFTNSNREKLAKIERDNTVAQKDGDRKKLAQVEKARKTLLVPIIRLFSQLDDRLKALLTTAQLARFDAADQPAPVKDDVETPSESSDVTQKDKETRPDPQPAPAKDEDSR